MCEREVNHAGQQTATPTKTLGDRVSSPQNQIVPVDGSCREHHPMQEQEGPLVLGTGTHVCLEVEESKTMRAIKGHGGATTVDVLAAAAMSTFRRAFPVTDRHASVLFYSLARNQCTFTYFRCRCSQMQLGACSGLGIYVLFTAYLTNQSEQQKEQELALRAPMTHTPHPRPHTNLYLWRHCKPEQA